MNIVVLFTFGYKMCDWAKKGHLPKEAILYNTLADNGVLLYSFSNSPQIMKK